MADPNFTQGVLYIVFLEPLLAEVYCSRRRLGKGHETCLL